MRKPRVQSPNFELGVYYFYRAWCPICGVRYDERDFKTLDELMDDLWKSWDFICWDCEQEIAGKP